MLLSLWMRPRSSRILLTLYFHKWRNRKESCRMFTQLIESTTERVGTRRPLSLTLAIVIHMVLFFILLLLPLLAPETLSAQLPPQLPEAYPTGMIPGGIPGGARNGILNGILGAPPNPLAPPAPPLPSHATHTIHPVRIGGGVQQASLIRQVRPQYPTLAK